MKENNYIVGLDVGTTKICTVVSRLTEDDIEVIAVGKSPSVGLRKGIVVDMDATINSIRDSIKDAERTYGKEVKDVYIGIAGGHIKSFRSSGVIGVKDEIITSKDIERAIESAKAVYVPLDREVLHIIPTEYIVDGEGEILNPIGMRGVRLEANVQIITGSVTSVQNLLKCCEKAGLNVLEIVLEPLASALAALREDEKEYGVILVDIGGGTTDIALLKNNTLIDTSVIGIGGNHFTNDISVSLRLPVLEAERIKKDYGTALFSERYDSNEVTIMVANREQKTIPKSYISEIVIPRCEELLYIIKQEIEKMSGYDIASYGVVFTGGASNLDGIDQLAESIIGLPIRIGMPEVEGLPVQIKDPMFSTSIGLLLYAQRDLPDSIVSIDIFAYILNKMKGWVRGLFR